MKHIRCAVWGEIVLSDLAMSIVDTFAFQRLHYILQTGVAYKIFPGAKTSRFEHSIGVYHVTKELIFEIEKMSNGKICLDERKKELIAITGLIHDIGHGPFSHLFDDWIKDSETEIPKTHEERSKWIFRDLVQKNDIALSNDEVEWICQRISNPPQDNWYDTLICNPYSSFDTDKIDYLIRDSKQFGILHAININRIFKNIKIIDNKLCFCDRIQNEIITFFEQREKMHSSIYRHPTVVKFQKFLLKYVFPNLPVMHSMDDFFEWNDNLLLSTMSKEQRKMFESREILKPFVLQPELIEDLSTVLVSPFYDIQKRIAYENTFFYSKKDCTKSYKINLF